MELLISIAAGVLFFTGFYLILQESLVRSILGILFLSNAANVTIFSFSGLVPGGAAFLGESHEMAANLSDPLIQALILTAIVIGFGFSLFFLVLALFAHSILGGDRISEGEYEPPHR